MYRSGTSSSASDHDRLIASVVAELRAQNMTNVRAAHLPNQTPPDLIGGAHIPDATAYHGVALVIVECETRDGLSDPHTEQQVRTFLREAGRVGGYLILAVPNEAKAAADALIVKVNGGRAAANAQVWEFNI